MTEQEQFQKCNTVINVLKRVAKGADVPLAERINACRNAIEVLCHNPASTFTGAKQPDKQ